MRDLLRAHTEPWKHVDDWSVHRMLTADPEGYLASLRDRLGQLASGQLALELPAKQIFTDDAGDFRVMPCVTGTGGAAVKTVKVVGTNLVQRTVPDQITVGKAVRLDPIENFISHVYDACLLSSARTGACAAVAIKKFTPAAQRIGIVGCGRVGSYVGLYLAATGDAEIVTFDQRPSRAAALASALTRGGASCGAGTWDEVADCDVLVLATTSRAPMVAPDDTSATLVASVGADALDQRELTDEWPATASVFADSPDAFEVGDLHAWRRAGLLDPMPLTLLDMFEPSFSPPGDRRVFVSTGSGLLDNLTIDYLLQRDRD